MFRRRMIWCTSGIITLLVTSLYAVSDSRGTTKDSAGPTAALKKVLTQQGSPYPHRPFVLKDDAELQSEFYKFRERLRQAVRDRDSEFISAVVSQDIKLSLGSPKKLTDLEIENPKALIWQEMEKTFALGCRNQRQGQVWICPSIFIDWDDELDPSSYLVVLEEKIPIYAQASTKASVIGFLSKEVVKIDREVQHSSPFSSGWIRVIQPNGRLGYIADQFTYSPIGYRAVFEKKASTWHLTLFLSGD